MKKKWYQKRWMINCFRRPPAGRDRLVGILLADGSQYIDLISEIDWSGGSYRKAVVWWTEIHFLYRLYKTYIDRSL